MSQASLAPGLLLLIGLLVLVVGFWAGIRTARWILRRRVGRTRRQGRRGEAKARRLIERAGYRVVEEQVTARGLVEVDGELVDYVVRADAVLRRRRRRYVAEFKGGAASSQVASRDTRRQLLEYAWLFDVDGVLLVDADRGHVHEIRFPGLTPLDVV